MAQTDTIAVLKRANNVLILASSPVDADSIGSALALYMALKKLGKTATVVAEEEIPENYGFLPQISAVSREFDYVRDFIVTIDCRSAPPGKVRHEIQGSKINIIITPQKEPIEKEQVSFSQGSTPYDCIVTVDAADPSQLGKIYRNFPELFHLAPVINIDHHTSNTSFGKINLVDIMAPSTTTLILPLIEELGQGLMDADIATLLLAGLITDTGSFQNPNTTPDAFATAAKLIGYGARQQEIIRHIYKTKKLSTLRLWGRILGKLQYDETHRLVWSTLTAKDFAEIGGSPDETEGVIDELMGNAPNTEIIFLLKEKGPREISGSIRTLTPTIDASKLAAIFDGGGHMQAAGFRIQGKTMPEVEQEILKVLREFQKERLRLPAFTSLISPLVQDQPAPAIPIEPKTMMPPPAPAMPAPKPPSAPLVPTQPSFSQPPPAPTQPPPVAAPLPAVPQQQTQPKPASPEIDPSLLLYGQFFNQPKKDV